MSEILQFWNLTRRRRLDWRLGQAMLSRVT